MYIYIYIYILEFDLSLYRDKEVEGIRKASCKAE